MTCFSKHQQPANIDFAGYADNNTPYTYSSNIENVLETSIRKNDSLVFNKSLGSKCRKMLSFNKI